MNAYHSMSSIPVSLLSIVFLFLPSGAHGSVTLTWDETAFLSSHSIVTRETFDQYPQPTYFDPSLQAVMIDAVTYEDSEVHPAWTIDRGSSLNPSNTLRSQSSVSDVKITFGDGGYVDAIGFLLEPFGFPNQFEFVVEEISGEASPFLAPRDIGASFLGFSSSEGIRRITIAQQPSQAGGLRTNFSFDNVSRTTVRPPLLEVSCNCFNPGFFEPPLDRNTEVAAGKRILPLRFTLCDRGGFQVTDADISPPVAEVDYLGPQGDVSYEPADFDFDSHATLGNKFIYADGVWQLDLLSKLYSAEGIYAIRVVSSDPETYVVHPTCLVQFAIP